MSLASAHRLAQDELQAADDLGMDNVHAELVATAAAVLMRSIALELRARRALAQRAEERRLNRLQLDTRDATPEGAPTGGVRVKPDRYPEEIGSSPPTPPPQRG